VKMCKSTIGGRGSSLIPLGLFNHMCHFECTLKMSILDKTFCKVQKIGEKLGKHVLVFDGIKDCF